MYISARSITPLLVDKWPIGKVGIIPRVFVLAIAHLLILVEVGETCRNYSAAGAALKLQSLGPVDGKEEHATLKDLSLSRMQNYKTLQLCIKCFRMLTRELVYYIFKL
jgi:hypothetical protein